MVGIIDDHLKKYKTGKLPLVYPLIFYTGQRPYHYSTCIFDLFEDANLMRDIFINPFQLVDVKKIPDEELRKKAYLGIMELSMKHIYERDILPHFKGMVSLFQQVLLEGNVGYLISALTYLSEAGELTDEQAFLETIETELSLERGEKTMGTLAEKWMREGYEKGSNETQVTMVRNLLKQGISLEVISKATGLSQEVLNAYLVGAHAY